MAREGQRERWTERKKSTDSLNPFKKCQNYINTWVWNNIPNDVHYANVAERDTVEMYSDVT